MYLCIGGFWSMWVGVGPTLVMHIRSMVWSMCGMLLPSMMIYNILRSSIEMPVSMLISLSWFYCGSPTVDVGWQLGISYYLQMMVVHGVGCLLWFTSAGDLHDRTFSKIEAHQLPVLLFFPELWGPARCRYLPGSLSVFIQGSPQRTVWCLMWCTVGGR